VAFLFAFKLGFAWAARLQGSNQAALFLALLFADFIACLPGGASEGEHIDTRRQVS
jgi:hypothetical protein